MGEAGEGFYVSQNGRRTDSRVLPGGRLAIYTARALAATGGLSAPGCSDWLVLISYNDSLQAHSARPSESGIDVYVSRYAQLKQVIS